MRKTLNFTIKTNKSPFQKIPNQLPDQLVNESSLEEGPSRDDSTDEVVRDTHRPSLCDGKSE